MPHPDEGLLHAWLDGELDAAEQKRVEALVANDPAWATAAAEARGLIAASARIVRTLDHVSPGVIPKRKPSLHARRRWMFRVAALAVVVAGTAVVLRRDGTGRPSLALEQPPIAAQSVPQAPVAVAKAAPPAAPAPQPSAGPETRRAVDLAKAKDVSGAPSKKQSVIVDSVRQGIASGGKTAAIDSTVAPSVTARDRAANFAAPRSALRESGAAAGSAGAPRCFQVQQPALAGNLTIRFDATQLEDSVRLGKVTLHGDTLRLEADHRVAIRVPCPNP